MKEGACRCLKLIAIPVERGSIADLALRTLDGQIGVEASIADLVAQSEAYKAELARDAIPLPDATGEQAVAAPAAPEVSDVAVRASAEREAAPPAPPRESSMAKAFFSSVRLVEDFVVPNLISKEQAQRNAAIQRAIEDNLRKEREQEAFRAFLRGRLDGEDG